MVSQRKVHKKRKILYAIQGTGNGHATRAIALVPEFKKLANVDVLMSGIQVEIELPFEVNYRLHGLSFIFGKKGGIDIWSMMTKVNFFKFLKEVYNFDVKKYDLVITDFEPVSAWAARWHGVPSIALSHQAAVKDKQSPKPSKLDPFGQLIIKTYAPTNYAFGFHFDTYTPNTFLPVLRDYVYNAIPTKKSHYVVYLPSYSNEAIANILTTFSDVQWRVFSKYSKVKEVSENIEFHPVNGDVFMENLITAEGLICGAGFEAPAEAINLNKKLMVVPMKGQYEQHCNASALEELGVPVLPTFSVRYLEKIKHWLLNDRPIDKFYPQNKSKVAEDIIRFAEENIFSGKEGDKKQFTYFPWVLKTMPIKNAINARPIKQAIQKGINTAINDAKRLKEDAKKLKDRFPFS